MNYIKLVIDTVKEMHQYNKRQRMVKNAARNAANRILEEIENKSK